MYLLRLSVSDGEQLLSNDRQHLNVDTIELIKATPGTCGMKIQFPIICIIPTSTSFTFHGISEILKTVLVLRCLPDEARPEKNLPIILKSRPSEQLNTTHCLARAFDKSCG